MFCKNKMISESQNLEFDRTHLEDMRELQKKSSYSDIEIIIDYRIFKAHKVILSRSPTFHEMFTSMPALKEVNLSDEISDSVESDIQNLFGDHDLDKKRKNDFLKFSSRTCETFLRYLYATNIKKEDINLDMILVAEKFSDKKLKEFCETHLLENINLRNVTRSLLVSLVTGCKKMKNRACEIIARNFCEMKFDKDFKFILDDENVLSAILDVFEKCQVTLLTEMEKEDDKKLENECQFLRNADLLIRVEDHHFLANKEILRKRNAVFKEIIDAASVDGFPTSINIPDMDQKTFKIFLQFIYTDEVYADDVTKKLLELAHKYTHDELKRFCEDEFRQRLNDENVIDSLITAVQFQCKNLESNAANFIVVRYDTMEKHEDYQKLLQIPDVANVIIKTSCNRIPKTSTEYFKGKFNFEISSFVKDEYLYSETFRVKDETLQICVKRLEDRGYLTVLLMISHQQKFNLQSTCLSVKLISIYEQHTTTRKKFHDFKTKYFGGFRDFLPWSVLEDPEYGYIKDGKITIEVDVTAV